MPPAHQGTRLPGCKPLPWKGWIAAPDSQRRAFIALWLTALSWKRTSALIIIRGARMLRYLHVAIHNRQRLGAALEGREVVLDNAENSLGKENWMEPNLSARVHLDRFQTVMRETVSLAGHRHVVKQTVAICRPEGPRSIIGIQVRKHFAQSRKKFRRLWLRVRQLLHIPFQKRKGRNGDEKSRTFFPAEQSNVVREPGSEIVSVSHVKPRSRVVVCY